MKNIAYLIFIFFINLSYSQSSITFNIDPSSYINWTNSSTPHVVGSFNNWDPGELAMSDDDGDGIWSITLDLEDGDYLYKFTLGDWGTQEFWTEEKDCLVWDGEYWNRGLTVAGADQNLDFVHWNQCAGEDPLGEVTLSFEVNSSAIVGGISTTIYAGGGFLGSAMAVPLSDDDGDGIYTGSTQVSEGSGGNYIFLNSPQDEWDWNAKEDLVGQDCADPDNYNDRIIDPIYEDTTLVACFGHCSGNGTGDCPSDVVSYNLTMKVNTQNITVGENGIYLGGGVFGNATQHLLNDDDNDGTWEVTIEVSEGYTGNYIFLNSPNDGGDWDAKEDLAGQECADPANFNDRI